MRHPVPPFCTVAATGAVVVWEFEHRAGILELDNGASTHDLPSDDVVLTSVSPSGAFVAVGSPTTLTLYDRDSGWTQRAEHKIGEPLFRLAVDDSGVVVGVTAHEDGAASRAVLVEVDRVEDQPLGDDVTVFTIRLDAGRRRVLLAGQHGQGSFNGSGEPFVRLFEWGDTDAPWNVLWDGPPPVDAPNGWLMPLAFGDIGVHDLDRLVVVSPDTHPDDVGSPVDTLDLAHLETVAVSPSGGQISWFWRGDGDVVHVRSARLADGTVTEHPDLSDIDAFPAVAIADDGCVTLVDAVRPNTVRVRQLRDGVVDTIDIPVAATSP